MRKSFERFLDENKILEMDSKRRTVRGNKNYVKDTMAGFMEVGTNPDVEFNAGGYDDVLADDSGREVGSNMELDYPYELPKDVYGSNNSTMNKVLAGNYKIKYYIPEKFFKDPVFYSNESILDDNRRYVVSVAIIELVTNAIINNVFNYIETYGKVNMLFDYKDSEYITSHEDIINLLIFKLRSRGFNTNRWKIKGLIGLCIDDTQQEQSKVKGFGKYIKNNILNSFDENIPMVPYDMKTICEEVPTARVCILVDKILDGFDCNISLRDTMVNVYDSIKYIRSNKNPMVQIKYAYSSIEALLYELESFWNFDFENDETVEIAKEYPLSSIAEALYNKGVPIYWDKEEIYECYVFADYLKTTTRDFTYDPPKEPVEPLDGQDLEVFLANLFNYITEKYFVYGEYISIVRIPDGWNYWSNY